MAAGIVYLDVDDEITSAAARIRQAQGRRVALVLPYGSRVATSRINFRLLSRDALLNEKQLAVVAGDSATRALAASAGLPVFASVGEYEGSLAEAPAAGTPPDGAAGRGSEAPSEATVVIPPATPKKRGRKASTVAAAPTPAPETSPESTAASEHPKPATPPPVVETKDARTGGTPRTGATAQVAIPWEGAEPAGLSPVRPWDAPGPRPASGPAPRGHVTARPGDRRSSRLPILIVLAAIALVVLVGGVGAYTLLPSASIVVTPREEAIPALDVVVTADPSVDAPDAERRLVPARVVSVEVSVEDTFPATGKRIEEERAKGTVRFSNLDFLRTNTVPAGSVVSTNAGVRFETVAAVTVPRANLVGLTVFPGRIDVNVTAVEPGLAGNVEPNTIVVVPRGENPEALNVVNPDATSGGTHEEFPQVAQEDVDAALAQLNGQLTDAFQARLTDPSIAAPGATVFPTTAQLGTATPSVDPATLIEQEVESFQLGLTAQGTVVTVDPAPVQAIAQQLIRGSVEPGSQLVAGSIDVQVAEPVVEGQAVSFTATATASQVAILDPEALRQLVLGRPLDEAREILAPYGDVELTAWPDWVGSVPTIADRVDVEIEQAVPVEATPSASGTS
jgi:hypothetical protein